MNINDLIISAATLFWVAIVTLGFIACFHILWLGISILLLCILPVIAILIYFWWLFRQFNEA